jgi:hypothetical protein
MLDSSVWSNENFAALPPRGRLLQIGMISIADDQGRLKAHPLYLAKEIFPYDHIEIIDVSKWLELMVENGTILLYTVEGKQYAQFLNWWEYQAMQFAKSSSYPRPEGWTDCIRFNGKGNQMMVCNWTTPKGERMLDTCDQEGKPLPFVMAFPAAKAPTQAGTKLADQAPAEVRTLVPAEAPAKVPTKVRTQAATEAPTEVRTQVNNVLNKDQDQEKTKNKNNNNNMRALNELVLAEAEKAVVVVGADALIREMDFDQKMALLSWLWLYNDWFEEDLDYRDKFRRSYGKRDPFAGMDNIAGVMVSQAKARRQAPLTIADREDMLERLAEKEQPQP